MREQRGNSEKNLDDNLGEEIERRVFKNEKDHWLQGEGKILLMEVWT